MRETCRLPIGDTSIHGGQIPYRVYQERGHYQDSAGDALMGFLQERKDRKAREFRESMELLIESIHQERLKIIQEKVEGKRMVKKVITKKVSKWTKLE